MGCAIFFWICFIKPLKRITKIPFKPLKNNGKRWVVNVEWKLIYHLPFIIYHSNSPFKFHFHIHTKWDAPRPFLYSNSVLFALFFVLWDIKRLMPFYIAFSSLKLKLVPLSNFDSTWILLPWAWTMCFTMESPRPVPPLSLVRLLSTR